MDFETAVVVREKSRGTTNDGTRFLRTAKVSSSFSRTASRSHVIRSVVLLCVLCASHTLCAAQSCSNVLQGTSADFNAQSAIFEGIFTNTTAASAGEFLSLNESIRGVVENCRRLNSAGRTEEVTLTVSTTLDKQFQVNIQCANSSTSSPSAGGSSIGEYVLQRYGFPSAVPHTASSCVRCRNMVQSCEGKAILFIKPTFFVLNNL